MIDAKRRKSCADWSEAVEYLRQADPLLAKLIDRVGPCTIARRNDYFAALCQSIVSQQISTLAARTVYQRFRFLFASRRPRPEELLKFTDEKLRSAGLSRQKIDYLRGIARAFASGQIPVRRLTRMTDEEVINSLIQLRGVGRWTAEMFLIFVLQRPDVLPVDDLGLQVGVQKLFSLPDRPKPADIPALAERWRPWRSIATWYLWRGA